MLVNCGVEKATKMCGRSNPNFGVEAVVGGEPVKILT